MKRSPSRKPHSKPVVDKPSKGVSLALSAAALLLVLGAAATAIVLSSPKGRQTSVAEDTEAQPVAVAQKSATEPEKSQAASLVEPPVRAELIPEPKPVASAPDKQEPEFENMPEPAVKPSPEPQLVAKADPAVAQNPPPRPNPSVEYPSVVDGKSLNQWLAELKNPDPAIRENAIAAIAQFGPAGKPAVKYLVERLSDVDGDVAIRALIALQTVGVDKNDYPTLVSPLLKTLQKGHPNAQMQAALALATLGPEAKAAIPTLADRTLRNPLSWKLRRAAAYALGAIAFAQKENADPRAVSALVNVLVGTNKDPCAQVRLQAIIAIAGIGPIGEKELQKVLFALQQMIRPKVPRDRETDPAVNIWARALLARLDKKELKDQIAYMQEQLRKSKDPVVRRSAVQALGALAIEDAVNDVIDALADKDANVAAAAAAAVGQLRSKIDESHANRIYEMLRSPDDQTQGYAAQAMGQLDEKSKKYIPALIGLLKDNEAVGGAAAVALGQIKKHLSDKDLAEIAALLKDRNSTTRALAAQTLGLIGKIAAKHVSDLIAALRDPDIVVASSAAAALGQMSTDLDFTNEQLADIAKLLKDPNANVRCHAADTLRLFGPKAKAHIPDLVACLRDENLDVITCAMIALASMGKEASSALPALMPLRKHVDKTVRDTATSAIAQIKGLEPPKKDPNANN
ncbi:MAG: hypothetical protein KatS3mg105_3197 [Gemmatales bacterium]|nr:MAG: hypothetical protein KatS3mg105_3197 [Gemmatales bacterium]